MKWTKHKLIYLFFCIAGLFVFAACSKDDDDNSPYAEDRFARALYYKYPNAAHVE
ncbi:MAG: hypothetical protein LUD15_13865 [Bacteroides sp.]|nr:hypothetical protein [Bacteroides sp.]